MLIPQPQSWAQQPQTMIRIPSMPSASSLTPASTTPTQDRSGSAATEHSNLIERTREDEQLGTGATMSNVLFCNVNHPDLKQQFPGKVLGSRPHFFSTAWTPRHLFNFSLSLSLAVWVTSFWEKNIVLWGSQDYLVHFSIISLFPKCFRGLRQWSLCFLKISTNDSNKWKRSGARFQRMPSRATRNRHAWIERNDEHWKAPAVNHRTHRKERKERTLPSNNPVSRKTTTMMAARAVKVDHRPHPRPRRTRRPLLLFIPLNIKNILQPISINNRDKCILLEVATWWSARRTVWEIFTISLIHRNSDHSNSQGKIQRVRRDE